MVPWCGWTPAEEDNVDYRATGNDDDTVDIADGRGKRIAEGLAAAEAAARLAALRGEGHAVKVTGSAQRVLDGGSAIPAGFGAISRGPAFGGKR